MQEEEEYEDNITLLDDGCFEVKGLADLEDVCLALALETGARSGKSKDDKEGSSNGDSDRERETTYAVRDLTDDLREFGTLSGFLCAQVSHMHARTSNVAPHKHTRARERDERSCAHHTNHTPRWTHCLTHRPP